MKGIIEKIVDDILYEPTLTYSDGTFDIAALKKCLTKHLTGLPLDPSQFVNGEPEEDGTYLCKTPLSDGEISYIILARKGKDWHWYNSRHGEYDNIRCYFTILSHCKLPE